MKLQNRNNNRAGFTMVEMLVALLILAITLVPLINMLTDGFAGIVRAGRTSSDLYEVQKLVEEAIYLGSPTSSTWLTVTFTDPSTPSIIQIPGVIREIRFSDTAITTFIPRDGN